MRLCEDQPVTGVGQTGNKRQKSFKISYCNRINEISEWTLDITHCFSTSVRPRPGKFFFYKTRARSQQIYW